MSFVDILLIIVILALIGAGIIYYLFLQRRNDIHELTQRKDAMLNTSIGDLLFILKNMELTGQTKRKYESLVAEWHTLNNFKFSEIESSLVGSEQYLEQMNLVKANSSLEAARDLIDESESIVEDLEAEVSQLMNLIESNDQRNEDLLERYNKARKRIMNHSFDYGPAIETLEKNIQYLELNFTRYNELASNGDYMEGKDMQSTIASDLESLEDILDRIPAMYDSIKNTYEPQIQDLHEGYQRMLDENYIFSNKTIDEDIDAIREDLDKAKTAIKNADLKEAKTLIDKAEREIDSLYVYMEGEFSAKQHVYSQVNQVKRLFEVVSENNRYASIEVDRISQSYILHHNQLEQINEFNEQINKQKGRFKEILAQMDDDQVIYSEAAETIDKISKRLNELDDRQKQIVQELSNLSKREKEAKSNLDLFEMEMRNMKRRLEKHHLPGLSQSYYDMFYKVTDQIEYLSQQMNHVKVDMDEVDRLEGQLEENIGQLEEMTENILDSASLTEYMIQHSNRFRYDYPEMDQAIREAEYLFYDQYKYAEALKVIEKSLYQVDNEGPTQVRRMYFQEKQNRIF